MSELILAQDEKEVNSDGIRFAGWSFKPGEISPSELLVLTAIGAFVNGKNECWPSVSTLARMSKVSRRSVQYGIRKLAEKKIIKVSEQESKTGNRSNRYKILVPRKAEWQKLKVIKLLLGIENISRTEVLVLLAMVDHIFFGRYSNNFAFQRKFTISQGDVAGKTGLLRDRVNLAVASLARKNRLSLPEVGNDEWVALKVDKESEKGKKLIYQLVGSEKAIRQLVELIDPY